MKPVSLAVAVGLVASFLGTPANAADVFAEPMAGKAGRGGYSLAAFVDGPQDLLAFTVRLPNGIDAVDLSSCGSTQGEVFAQCRHLPEHGELAVLAFRYDGAALTRGELALGNVRFNRAGSEALPPLAPRVADAQALHGAAHYHGLALPTDIEVYLGADGLPAASPDPVRITVAGPNVLRWTIRPGEPIAAITALPGLSQEVFQPQPQAHAHLAGRVWTAVDNASTSTNGTYKYDVSVRKSDGTTVTQDPTIENDIPA